MTPDGMVEQSKWLSWALRHDPAGAGITLDEHGWTPTAGLLAAAERANRGLSGEDLERIVATSGKQRFSLSGDGLRIRANQGHSVPVDLDLPPVTPPDALFHGTADRFLAAILQDGLNRQARHHVHLSADRATAIAVGTRHGRPVVLLVDARRMHAEGHRFYRSTNGVWLVDAVPTRYLTRDPSPEAE